MDFEIITIGDELLIGQTVDTNSVYLAKQLGPLGLNVSRKTAIRDEKDAIVSALDESLSRVNLVIITGGLGPTNDDITKSVLNEYFKGGDYRLDEAVLTHLKQIFANRGRDLLETNQAQALLPSNAITLFNSKGTAPGMLFKSGNQLIASMPGVPNEVRAITEESLWPWLTSNYQLKPVLHRTLITTLVPESLIAQKLQSYEAEISGCKLAYLPTYNSVKLRLTRTDEQLQDALFEAYWERLIRELGPMLFHDQEISLNQWLIDSLSRKSWSISTAESCTGGYLGNQLVLVPGASTVFKGSIIAYDNSVKQQLLKVPAELIQDYGAVSEAVAQSMVEGVCEALGTEVGIATTGIAGPSGGTNDKPVGTIFIAVKVLDKVKVEKHLLRGSRQEFMVRAETIAISMLKDLC